MNWSTVEVLEAVQARLSGNHPHQSWTFERAELAEGDRVLVVFRIDAQDRFGVHYSLADLPQGANTGEPCDTPGEWASEIAWDMDEQVLTGGIGRAEHSRGPDGLVLLGWRW